MKSSEICSKNKDLEGQRNLEEKLIICELDVAQYRLSFTKKPELVSIELFLIEVNGTVSPKESVNGLVSQILKLNSGLFF